MTDTSEVVQTVATQPTWPRVFTPIPASIVEALCHVQGEVEVLTKDNKNDHGGFNYTSVDQVYALLTRRLAEVGLVIMPLEVERPEIKIIDGKNGPQKWCSFHYGFALATAKDTWFDPTSVETLMVQITGPQTFAAAKSFAQKSYLRALLKIPTGDVELDSAEQEESDEEATQRIAAQRKKAPSSKKKAVEALSAEESAREAKSLAEFFVNSDGIRVGVAPEALEEWAKDNASTIDRLQPADAEALRRIARLKVGAPIAPLTPPEWSKS